jgi:hypothetical protein
MRFIDMSRLGENFMFKVSLLAGLLLFALMMAGCAKKVVPPRAGEVAAPQGGQFLDHTVAEGETLAQVADNYYGDPGLSDRIASDNRIADPERIIPGSLLRLRFNADEWESARKRSAALASYNKGVENSSAWRWIPLPTWWRHNTTWRWFFSSEARQNRLWSCWRN